MLLSYMLSIRYGADRKAKEEKEKLPPRQRLLHGRGIGAAGTMHCCLAGTYLHARPSAGYRRQVKEKISAAVAALKTGSKAQPQCCHGPGTIKSAGGALLSSSLYCATLLSLCSASLLPLTA